VSRRHGDVADRWWTALAHPALVWLTVAAAASVVWLAPRPPMADLPQHVAQIVHLKALLLGESQWSDLLRLNFATVYLVPYLLGLALSFLLSATAAIKLLFTAALVAFVISCRQLRAERGGDPRLDVLFVPGFLGYAYDSGFLSFLVAAPIAVQMIRIGWRYAEDPRPSDAGWLLGLGGLLLVSHGLMFLYAGLVCGVLLLVLAGSVRRFATAAVPYVALLSLCAFYARVVLSTDGAATWTPPEWWSGPHERLLHLFVYPFSAVDPSFIAIGVVLLLATGLVGRPHGWRPALPLGVTVGALLLLPDSAFSTDYLTARFGLFLLPFLAICFAADARGHATAGRLTAGLCVVALCWTVIGIKASRAVGFAQEARSFDAVLAAASPGRRLSSSRLIGDAASAAAVHPSVYAYYATWYEVERGGFVDFSFATFHPQIVRFKSIPPWRRVEGDPAETFAFDWSDRSWREVDYFLARRTPAGDWPRTFVTGAACDLSLLREAGPWGLFARGSCRP
jgi:hypothetical protein